MIHSFVGVFDGNGHVIRNVVINQPLSDYVGLFGYLGSSGQIKNMGVENVNIQGRDYVGGLVAYIDQGTITSCYVSGLVSGRSYVGGLVGKDFSGKFTSCYTTGTVSGSSSVGGLVGDDMDSTITSCYAIGSVTGGTYVGGLVGESRYSLITSCYTTSTVSGTETNSIDTGGLVGENMFGTITSCYTTGTISSLGSHVGGLVGYSSGTITSSYATLQAPSVVMPK
jgi:hypothetical protein